MSEDKKRVICIVLGRNESQILNFLEKFEGAVSFNDIFEMNGYNPTLRYESTLSELLRRLLKKNLVRSCAFEDGMFYQITEKGRKLIELVRDY